MKLYFVMKSNPGYSVVNDDLEVISGPPEEIEEIFLSKGNAYRCKDMLEKQAKELAEKFGYDVDEYFIAERDIEEE